MIQRGRKSSVGLSVLPTAPYQRPDPPADLTEDEAAEWRAIVGRMPPEWFTRETWPLLTALCQAVIRLRDLNEDLRKFDPRLRAGPVGLSMYDTLTKMADREAKAVVMLSRQMRLTHQSRYAAEKANTLLQGKRLQSYLGASSSGGSGSSA